MSVWLIAIPLIALPGAAVIAAIWLLRSDVSLADRAAVLRSLGLDLVRLPGRLRRVANDPRTPTRARWCLIGLAIYVASPVDLIPDFLPVIGLLDELILVPLVLIRIKRMIPPEVWADHFPDDTTAPIAGPAEV